MLQDFKNTTIGILGLITICFIIFKFLKTLTYQELFELSFGLILTVLALIYCYNRKGKE